MLLLFPKPSFPLRELIHLLLFSYSQYGGAVSSLEQINLWSPTEYWLQHMSTVCQVATWWLPLTQSWHSWLADGTHGWYIVLMLNTLHSWLNAFFPPVTGSKAPLNWPAGFHRNQAINQSANWDPAIAMVMPGYRSSQSNQLSIVIVVIEKNNDVTSSGTFTFCSVFWMSAPLACAVRLSTARWQ